MALYGLNLRFESSVILYGSQTHALIAQADGAFESSVILYGSQTYITWCWRNDWFESSVILYGSQTPSFTIFNAC